MLTTAVQLAIQALRAGSFAQARTALERELATDQASRSNPQVWSALAQACLLASDLAGYEEAANRVVALSPRIPAAHYMQGDALRRQRHWPRAIAAFERGLALSPDDPSGQRQLLHTLFEASRYEDAGAFASDALRRVPAGDGRRESLVYHLARATLALGDAGGAVRLANEGAREFPRSFDLAKLAAFASNYDATLMPVQSLEMHKRVGEFFSLGLPVGTVAPMPRINTGDPLRIALISPDLREHAVARFVEPILRHVPRNRAQLTCISTHATLDATGQKLAGLADRWWCCAGMTPIQVAERIRTEKIDVLIDLAGYSSEPLLAVLALRPAPMLATYLGYPNTTGVDGIGFRLVDALTDPPGSDSLATERLLRVPGCFLCFQPPDQLVEVAERPSDGTVVFGCFNQYMKFSDTAIECWSQVLSRVPLSRLVIKNHAMEQAVAREQLLKRFDRAGISRERVTLLPAVQRYDEHLAVYNSIDIALDTFPYNGTTTTCEALLMGVPVLSVAGDRHVARVGLSLLTAVGQPDWCAGNSLGLVAIAGRLAGEVARGEHPRRAVREKFLRSTLTDGGAFGSHLLRTLREAYGWEE